jgi:hypothetical protein
MDNSLTEQIDDLNILILAEMECWDKIKTDPAEVVNINTLMLDTYVFALSEYLMELGLIDKDEFTVRFKTRLLETLKFHRKNVEDILTQQQIVIPRFNGKLQ